MNIMVSEFIYIITSKPKSLKKVLLKHPCDIKVIIHKIAQIFPFIISFKALLTAQSILSLIWHFGEVVKDNGPERGIAMSLMVPSL